MTFSKYSLPFCALLLLGACSYAVESSNQDVTFMTPKAQDAKCYVYIDKLKYQVFPPQTINIKKSKNEMKIVCDAPGNRHLEMFVPSSVSKRAFWGGPVGLAWDAASDSLFYYPSVIAIDFSHEEIKPNKLPQHNNSDIKQPEEYDLEEFRPSQPRLNSDRNKVNQPILRRGEEYSDEYVGDAIESNSGIDPVQGTKGDLQSVISDLTGQAGQEDQLSGDAISDPLSIYPGQ